MSRARRPGAVAFIAALALRSSAAPAAPIAAGDPSSVTSPPSGRVWVVNHHEKYVFDVRGYLVVRNALIADQVAALSEQFDRVRAKGVKRHYGSDRTRLPADADRAWSSASLLEWGGPYIDLIDLPTIAPYLEELLGVGYRLDHDYLNVNNAEDHRSLYLHGGGQGAGGDTTLVGPTDGGQCYYRYHKRHVLQRSDRGCVRAEHSAARRWGFRLRRGQPQGQLRAAA